MALQRVIPITISLQGDGVSVEFTLRLMDDYQTAGSKPDSAFVINSPVQVDSITVDIDGNVVIILASPLGSGAVQSFTLGLVYANDAVPSLSPILPQNVTIASGGVVSVDTAKVQYETPTTAELSAQSISLNSSGDSVIIPAVAGQVIRVFRIFVVSASSIAVTPRDGIGDTPFTGPLTVGSFVLDFDAEPWFTTSVGHAFVLNLSSSAQVSGRVYYTQG